ncbi:replicative helicase loader/inhibitor [Paenibacillus sp. Dod16]|uniref:replicative helicase loader/inhibitor n=1 Tax=Paenibacillus sp. Dod16 TaxID=3416392 RepID=UPI003CF6BB93
MNNKELLHLLSIVVTAYPTVQVSEEMETLWGSMLGDVSYKRAAQNLAQHIKTSKYPPTIADIRGNITPLSVENLRIQTQERFRLMDNWQKNACPRPRLTEGKQHD